MQCLALIVILQLWLFRGTNGVVPQLKRLNVQCDRSGMRVIVDFDIPFNGIIFSKGHFNDANCRYVNPVSQRNSYMFFIPSSHCGTIATENRRDASVGYKNVIIIQNDPDFQEVWDMARKISCDWITRIDKFITFAPYGVDTLGIKEIAFPGDTVDCWMDVKRGHGPFAPLISGVVPIGDPLTIAIYIKDKDRSFDVRVKDCYAYDNPDYKAINTRVLQLTDSRGCTVRDKIVKGFFRTRDVRNSGATIIAYGIINSFKFPEKMDVFLACNVEVCKGGCDNPCQPEVAVAGIDTVSQENETPKIVQMPDETPIFQSPDDTPLTEDSPIGVENTSSTPLPDITTSALTVESGSDDGVSTTTVTIGEEESNESAEDGATESATDASETETSEEEETSESDVVTEPTTTSTTTTTTTTTTPAPVDDSIGEEADTDDMTSDGTETDASDETESEANENVSAEVIESDNEEEEEPIFENLESEESRSSRQVSIRVNTNGKQKASTGTKSKSVTQSAKPKSNSRINTGSIVAGNVKTIKASTKTITKTRNDKTKKDARIVIASTARCNGKDCRTDANKKQNVNRSSNGKKKRKPTTIAPPNDLIEPKEVRARLPSPARLIKKTKNVRNSGKIKKQSRNRRSILITSGNTNATFADMTHSISMISPIEDFDEKELEIWEFAKSQQNRVCVAVIDLILSSFIFIWFFVIITIVSVIYFRKKVDSKCNS